MKDYEYWTIQQYHNRRRKIEFAAVYVVYMLVLGALALVLAASVLYKNTTTHWVSPRVLTDPTNARTCHILAASDRLPYKDVFGVLHFHPLTKDGFYLADATPYLVEGSSGWRLSHEWTTSKEHKIVSYGVYDNEGRLCFTGRLSETDLNPGDSITITDSVNDCGGFSEGTH